MEKKADIKPSKKWFLLPIFIFFAGPLFGAYLLYSTLSSAIHTTSFRIPGTWKFVIPYAGDYSLWTSTNNALIAKQIPQDLVNIHLKFSDPQRGHNLMFSPKVGWQDHTGNYFTFSLGTLRFNYAGTYQVQTYGSPSLFYKIHLKQPSLLRIIRAIILASFLALLGVVVGILSAIILLVKRINAQNMQTNEQKPKPTNELTTERATTWAMICHLSGFAGFLFPLANVFVPLIIWSTKRQESSYVDSQGKEAVNFQISITIYYILSAALIFIIIGLFLLPLLAAFQIVAMIIASVETAHAKPFKYPLSIRFLK